MIYGLYKEMDAEWIPIFFFYRENYSGGIL